ncbi:MAG: DNA-binding protein [Planctomyces sp.]|nr:DNA-binding protein [Planctomyces sp.]
MFTPPELAQLWGVKPEKVIAWIRSGELRALDFSTNAGVGRPRYRICENDALAFELLREVHVPTRSRKRARPRGEDVIEFF